MKFPRRTEEPVGLRRALRHPIRRKALRRLHAGEGSRSSLEIAQELCLSLSTAAYHMRVLDLYGAAKLIEGLLGSPAARFESAIAGDPWVMARLAATEAEDEAAVRHLIHKRPRGAI